MIDYLWIDDDDVFFSVVEILELFNHPSEELKLAVQQQLDLFNAQDSYWTVSSRVFNKVLEGMFMVILECCIGC